MIATVDKSMIIDFFICWAKVNFGIDDSKVLSTLILNVLFVSLFKLNMIKLQVKLMFFSISFSVFLFHFIFPTSSNIYFAVFGGFLMKSPALFRVVLLNLIVFIKTLGSSSEIESSEISRSLGTLEMGML